LSSPSQASAKPDAQSVYSQRHTALESERSGLQRRDRLFGFSKLFFAVVAIITAIWLARSAPALLAWAIAPALVFIALWIAHERLLRKLDESKRLEEFYRRGVARLADDWAGKGDTGERFLDARHPYARDLDLFGSGSLYQLISQASSAPGQHTLAGWLLAAAESAEILQRQEAVRELAPRLDLREQLALAAGAIHEGTPEALTSWAESREDTVPGWLLYAAPPLALLWLGCMIYWFATGTIAWFVLISLINAAVTMRFIGGVNRAAAVAAARPAASCPRGV
jgi:hypothetical protein